LHAFAIIFTSAEVVAFEELKLALSIAEQYLGDFMEHTGTLALEAPNGQIEQSVHGMEEAFSFGSIRSDRGSEARRFLFAAAHHGTREDASLGNFPGKFAWIAVVLFVLSFLIAVIG